MKVTTLGIDLAKNVLQRHGFAEPGKTVLKRQLNRDQMATFFVNLPPCLNVMEACTYPQSSPAKIAQAEKARFKKLKELFSALQTAYFRTLLASLRIAGAQAVPYRRG